MKNLDLMLAGLLLLAGCGSGNESTSPAAQAPAPNADKQTKTVTPDALQERPTFKFFSVIREFGGVDTGALFVLLPNEPGMKITGISGPKFLGRPRVDVLNHSTVGGIFNTSSFSMSIQNREQLLNKFSGANIIYFERYQGQLCTDKEFEINVTGTLGQWSPTLTFKFSAVAKTNDECSFHTLGLETKY